MSIEYFWSMTLQNIIATYYYKFYTIILNTFGDGQSRYKLTWKHKLAKF